MEKQEKKCWDMMKCEKEVREACPAFQLDSSDECWFMASHHCIPKLKQNFKNCLGCPWYCTNCDLEKL